jgi:hypothetical protein
MFLRQVVEKLVKFLVRIYDICMNSAFFESYFSPFNVTGVKQKQVNSWRIHHMNVDVTSVDYFIGFLLVNYEIRFHFLQHDEIKLPI